MSRKASDQICCMFMILTQCPLILIAPSSFVRCDSSTQKLSNFAICWAREYCGENARIVCEEHLFPPDRLMNPVVKVLLKCVVICFSFVSFRWYAYPSFRRKFLAHLRTMYSKEPGHGHDFNSSAEMAPLRDGHYPKGLFQPPKYNASPHA